RWPRDWSSDVCSSDLNNPPDHRNDRALITHNTNPQQNMAGSAVSVSCKDKAPDRSNDEDVGNVPKTPTTPQSEFHRHSSSVTTEIGRASCRERVKVAV